MTIYTLLFDTVLLVAVCVLLGELVRLRGIVREVCSQKLDDLCWMDLYKLADAIGCLMPDMTTLPKDVMMSNCSKYIDCLNRCPRSREMALMEYCQMMGRKP